MERTKYTLYLDPEQLDLLRAEHKRSGAPVAELIRRAIDERYGRERRNGRAAKQEDTP